MIVFDAASFGKAIQSRRNSLHYTQAYVAQVTGFSASFISDIERGKETAEIGKVLSLANLLGLNVEVNPRGEV